MGIYVNPIHGSKVDWLEQNAVRCETADFNTKENYALIRAANKVPLACAYNGSFIAIGVAYSFDEALRFLRDDGGRMVHYYLVELNKLNEAAGISAKIKESFVEPGPNEYRCAVCKGVFEKAWTDEEADAERISNFPDVPKEECATICDDCYQAMGFPKNLT